MNATSSMKMMRGLAGMASMAGSLDPTLPSVMAARRLWTGEKHALPAVGVSIGMRAMIIGVGLSLAGLRGRHVLWGSLASSAMIEAYVLSWTYQQVMAGKFARPAPEPEPLAPVTLAGLRPYGGL